MEISKKSLLGALLITVVGLVVGIGQPAYPQLSPTGHYVLMVLLITVGLWVFKPFGLPFSMSALFLMAALLIIGIPMGRVFSGFTTGAIWTLIPALLFGHIILKTGLGKRIAILLLKSFNPSYGKLVILFFIIGLIISVLTPSIVVRIAIMLPIALGCLEACQVKGDSREGALILLTSLMTAMIPGTAWFTGSLFGPVTQGMYDAVPELRGLITFASWSQVNFLPVAVVTVVVIGGGYLFFRPKHKLAITKEAFVKEYQSLGVMSRHEKLAAVIMFLSFVMFLFGGFGWHQVPDPAIVLVAAFCLAVTGVLKQADLATGVNWDNVIFMGTAMGLSGVFAEVGLSAWISSILIPLLRPISGNPWLFVYAVMIILFVWRFFDIAVLVPTKAILVPTLPLIGQEFGIHPLVWVPIFVLVGNSFFLSYTSGFVLAGQSVVKEKGWTQRQINTYGIFYGIACLIALAVSIPYWSSLGFFHY
ncbi:MAG: SLC13 family permease [Lachnospiraceae bacterium]|nr:SLC13 family permease [Lachnospiraceae bacterium]